MGARKRRDYPRDRSENMLSVKAACYRLRNRLPADHIQTGFQSLAAYSEVWVSLRCHHIVRSSNATSEFKRCNAQRHCFLICSSIA